MSGNSDNKVMVNGRAVPGGEARVCALDRGFLYGDGFFETTRIYAGRPFRFEEHIERMQASCRWADWERVPEAERLRADVDRLIELNDVQDGYLRVSVSPGPDEGGTELSDFTVLIQARPMDLPPPGEAHPLRLVKSDYARGEHCPTVAHKTLSYFENKLALSEGKKEGADEVYFLNHRGHLAEGAISNLFFVADGTVHTPAPSCGLLPGIARKTVLKLCERESIALKTGRYGEEELLEADEAFCTNSLRGVMPVRSVAGRQPFESVPGAVTSRLQALYGRMLREACAEH